MPVSRRGEAQLPRSSDANLSIRTLADELVDAHHPMLAAVAARLAELDSIPLPAPPDADAISARTAQLAADVVEPAKVKALEKLGEGERPVGIARRWINSKL